MKATVTTQVDKHCQYASVNYPSTTILPSIRLLWTLTPMPNAATEVS